MEKERGIRKDEEKLNKKRKQASERTKKKK